MRIAFTAEQFFRVFAQYNEALWPMPVVLNLLALAATALLFSTTPWQSRLISTLLSFLWAWMAIAYHLAFFTAINPAAWVFGCVFLAGAFWFVITGLIQDKLRFGIRGGIRGWAGGILIGYALIVYPLLSYLLGHHYPAVPTFGLPCPTTIFTIGILMFAVAPVPKSVFAVPLAWAAVGSFAAFGLGVYQDLGLLAAGLTGLVAIVAPRPPTPVQVRPLPKRT